MISINEVIPRPSHPISKHIIFGIKINMFIDVLNNSTVYVNRSLFGNVTR